jgi:hypothetical protein
MRRDAMLALLLAATAAAGSGAAARTGGAVLKATLSGKEETPMGAPGGHGSATIRVKEQSVCWRLVVAGIDRPRAAHIHEGRPGRAGPVVVPLGKSYRATGCARVAAAVARGLLARPSAYYVNVHTKRYPLGAVRGQLEKSAPAGASGGGDGGGGSSGGYGGYGGYGDYGYGDTGP